LVVIASVRCEAISCWMRSSSMIGYRMIRRLLCHSLAFAPRNDMDEKRLAKITCGARNQAWVYARVVIRIKSPENNVRFRGHFSYRQRGKSNQTRVSLHPSYIQTILSAPEFHRIMQTCHSERSEESARGLYHRSGIHLYLCNTGVTLPRRFLFSCQDYTLAGHNLWPRVIPYRTTL